MPAQECPTPFGHEWAMVVLSSVEASACPMSWASPSVSAPRLPLPFPPQLRRPFPQTLCLAQTQAGRAQALALDRAGLQFQLSRLPVV